MKRVMKSGGLIGIIGLSGISPPTSSVSDVDYAGPPRGTMNAQRYFEDEGYLYKGQIDFDPRQVKTRHEEELFNGEDYKEIVNSNQNGVNLVVPERSSEGEFPLPYLRTTGLYTAHEKAPVIGTLLYDVNRDGKMDVVIFELLNGPEVRARYLKNVE